MPKFDSFPKVWLQSFQYFQCSIVVLKITLFYLSLIICLHTIIGFQVFLSNANILDTVGWFQVFLSYTNILDTVGWFQVFLSKVNHLHDD